MTTAAPIAVAFITDPAELKARFKLRCPAGNTAIQNWRIRTHRAISWYKDACECPPAMSEARFLFLWIALNSLYSRWDNLTNIPGRDGKARQDLIWRVYNGPGRAALELLVLNNRAIAKRLLENPYLSEAFWRDPANPKAKGFGADDANYLASNLKHREYGRILDQIFSRLYVLRGQIVHGAATSNSKLNKKTRDDCLQMLGLLVPAIIHLVIDHHREDEWPELCYPPQ